MKKPTIALFLILMSLLIIAPKLWAQGLICEEANGLLWCYNDQACGQPCNEVCATAGAQPIANNTVWFEAQDTEGECIAISQAFGLGNTVNFGDFRFGCIEDEFGTHTVGGGLIPPILCATSFNCPEEHRTGMDTNGVPCGPDSRRSICPCEQSLLPQFINLSPTTATNNTGTDHTVTAKVDTDGTPESGVLVTFGITSGPNTGQVSNPNTGECSVNNDCTTDGNGEVSWTYTSNGTTGTDIIVSTFTNLAGSVIESNTVEKLWVPVPIPTLSEWGLIVMAGVLGIVGFMVIRRRKVVA